MALNLMGGACINEDVISGNTIFASNIGISVYNIAKITTTILLKNTDGSYLAHVDIVGNQIGPVSGSTFPWLSMNVANSQAMKLTETSKYHVYGSEIPFYYQAIMSDVGYNPMVHIDNANKTFEAGRIYNTSGDYGGWSMNSLKTGKYAFGYFVKVW